MGNLLRTRGVNEYFHRSCNDLLSFSSRIRTHIFIIFTMYKQRRTPLIRSASVTENVLHRNIFKRGGKKKRERKIEYSDGPP